MKVISHNGLRIIYNQDEYVIKTPIGLFKDINEAVQSYPSLKEVKRVKQCKLCGTYFLDIVRMNNRVYCSEKCSKKGKSNITMDSYYDKLFVNSRPFDTNKYTQEIKDAEDRRNKNYPLGYVQDDTYWGLGSGNLTGTPANNPKSEHKILQNEKKRLGIA